MNLSEFNIVAHLTSGYRRHPNQLNTLFGSDAEVLRLSDSDPYFVALSTDGIVEEIAQGLYRDPFLIGWMTVMVNLSDLAAVGAQADGILIQLVLPHSLEVGFLSGIRNGIQAACSACDTYVLGGDVNRAEQLSTSGTAIGRIPEDSVISRIGCQAGELLYSTGLSGLGTAFAFAQVIDGTPKTISYQPTARLKEGEIIRQYASACLDTSDGLIAGLAQLEAVNSVGFDLSESISSFLHPDALELALLVGLPLWMMLAGPHGDFELIFSVPPENVSRLLKAAESINWKPVLLGNVSKSGLMLDPGTGVPVRTEAWQIANLFEEANGDPEAYLGALHSFHRAFSERAN